MNITSYKGTIDSASGTEVSFTMPSSDMGVVVTFVKVEETPEQKEEKKFDFGIHASLEGEDGKELGDFSKHGFVSINDSKITTSTDGFSVGADITVSFGANEGYMVSSFKIYLGINNKELMICDYNESGWSETSGAGADGLRVEKVEGEKKVNISLPESCTGGSILITFAPENYNISMDQKMSGMAEIFSDLTKSYKYGEKVELTIKPVETVDMDPLLFYKADAVKDGYADEGLFKVFTANSKDTIDISFDMPAYDLVVTNVDNRKSYSISISNEAILQNMQGGYIMINGRDEREGAISDDSSGKYTFSDIKAGDTVSLCGIAKNLDLTINEDSSIKVEKSFNYCDGTGAFHYTVFNYTFTMPAGDVELGVRNVYNTVWIACNNNGTDISSCVDIDFDGEYTDEQYKESDYYFKPGENVSLWLTLEEGYGNISGVDMYCLSDEKRYDIDNIEEKPEYKLDGAEYVQAEGKWRLTMPNYSCDVYVVIKTKRTEQSEP